MPESGFGDWDVEGLRVSIFHQTIGVPFSQAGLWAKVTGNEPESVNSRPQQGVTRVVGRVGENNLILASENDRIDWLVLPIANPTQQVSPVLTLKGTDNTLPILQGAVKRSLEAIPVVLRLAFGPTLVREVSDLKQGIKQLSAYLPNIDFGSLEGIDFVYQVNRRRRSVSVSHVQINRLARWSTEQIGGIELRVTQSEQPHLRSTGNNFTRKLHLDINTTPTPSAISNDKIPALFGELVTLADELAIKGDVP